MTRSLSWGQEPSPSETIIAATADVVTAPVQIPALAIGAIHNAATQPSRQEIEAAKKRSEAEAAERERVFALARTLLARLQVRPDVLGDDAFWNENAREPLASHYALIWFLHEPSAPHSPELNARLTARFPDDVDAILSQKRTTHAELTALVANPAVPYKIREAAIDTLVRDKSFDFCEPWRSILLRDFHQKTGLLFGTRRYTRAELVAIRDDPAQSPDMRREAEGSLQYNFYKPDPAPISAAPGS